MTVAKRDKTGRKYKVGRPTRAQASKKARKCAAATNFDARSVLEAIAGDASAPASARVMAARSLLVGSKAPPDPDAHDPLTELAIKLLRKGEK